jgi:ATP-binding cassette subfamily B protein
MTIGWSEVCWPADRLGDALAALGQSAGLTVRPVERATPPTRMVEEGEALGRWIEAAAAELGLETESVETPYGNVDRLLSRAAPALLRLPGGPTAGFLALLGNHRSHVTLLTPELTRVRLPLEAVRAELCREIVAPCAGVVDRLLTATEVRGRRRERARQALFTELLASAGLGGCWLVRSAGGAGVLALVHEARLPRLLLALGGVHLVEYGLWILSWWLLGWMTFQGRLDLGWLTAWLLLLFMLVPFHLLTTWTGGLFAVRAGALLKRRLLFGALRLEPEEIRHQGAGQLLGRVLEAEAIEAMALTGGFLSLTALIELALAGVVLGAGGRSGLHVVLLLATLAATGWLGFRYYRRRRRWTEERLKMTNDLVERMIGHRTRLAQEARAHWNDGEDQALERYLGVSQALDRRGVVLQAVIPRSWLIVGLLGLAPAFVTGNPAGAVLAVAVGGIVLAYQAFRNLVDGLERLAAAAIAWERVQALWHAAARQEPIGQPEFAVSPAADGCRLARRRTMLLDVRDLVFRYPHRAEPVLQGVDMRIRAGDRLLLEGPSGGGKSTLAMLLAGGRVPASGLLLLGGLDRETLGADGWRRRVVIAPQFHDNHVLMGTFAFNALMGRGWPPRPADLDEAERICRALELAPLLERMPAGLGQLVGETGWQLSHGEKSRLYIARALLQRADLIILDESFAALDPHTLQRALTLVLERAPTVLVIAHP